MFFELHSGGERAVLVQIAIDGGANEPDLGEFIELVRSAGGDPAAVVRGSRRSPTAKYFVGKGKLEEMASEVERVEAELVVFNHALSPSQERNLEAFLKCRVIARTGLILDIFAQRARTHEGKLQVELAQLKHISTRLIRGWTHLERQKGGIGLRGPGETQLETDRRLLRARVSTIESRLDKVRQQRAQNRRARQRAEVPLVSLVGYTNAGKSTLFNAWSESGVYVADQLFATLDPTLARVEIEGLGGVIIADTVGFIADLPHSLVEAFRATLEETLNASLLVHVIDVAADDREFLKTEVELVLDEIGAGDIPQLIVFNKIDLLEREPRMTRDSEGRPNSVSVSAKTGAGLDLLRDAIGERLAGNFFNGCVELTPAHGKLRAALYAMGAVKSEDWLEAGGSELDIHLPESDWTRLKRQYGF
ncbi:MAG: GTPase HflX [Luminiphilus sp.]|nr:GTPase HflX [Luminiphilus sp.]